MKHSGSISFVSKERREDLFCVYRKLIETKHYINMNDIVSELVTMPAPRFYIGEHRAAIVLSRMAKGEKLCNMTPNNQEMFAEIYRRAMKIKKKNPQIDFLELARIVISQPAPKFYLTESSVNTIIFRTKKEWFEQRKKKLKHLFY